MPDKVKLPKPSDMFIDIVCTYGTIRASCELCSREHFASYNNDGNFNEGELEELRKKAKEKPEKYIEWPDSSSISHGTIEGKQAVWGCECNGMFKYENFIWTHRYLIAEYLMKRANDEAQTAKEDLDKLGVAPGSRVHGAEA